MSRPKGSVDTCAHCGQTGHRASRSGGCSPTYLAAQLVLEGKASIAMASERFGISKQAISERLIKYNGYHAPRWSAYR